MKRITQYIVSSMQYMGSSMQYAVSGIAQLIKKQPTANRILHTATCLLLFCQLSYAQLYPVQVNQTLIPPYNTKLNSYATSSSVKLRLYLTMTDVNISNRQVRLKLKIKGQGLNIQSADFVTGAPIIYLNGGTQLQFTNIDLAPYFQLNNLLGINPQQYNRPLPEGTYKICWEVYDYRTNQLISNPNFGCENIYLLLNDPPFLNLPQRGDQLTETEPTNIIFQWTPRHASATNVSYEFELRELWDTQIDPQVGFLSSPNYYTETTRATTLLYNISKPALLPGHTYAWRVQAKSSTGLSENSVFKNDGYSEIFYFTYTNTCYPPTFVLAEPLNTGIVKISWQTNPDQNKYHVQYKRADVDDAEWFEVFSYNNQAQIANLQEGVTYNFRVGGLCNTLTDLDQTYSYSGINQFTMPTADETVSYSCGIVPEIEITNTDPLGNIGINETFTAGDFPVTVKEIQGSNGIYSGTGYIVVPYLADTKIAVEFSGIKINTDYQLYDGLIQTTYDPTWSSVEDVDDLFNGGDGQVNSNEVNFPIEEILIDPNGDILIVGKGGQPVVELAGGEDYVITDSGDPNSEPPIPPRKWHVDEDGNVTPLGEEAQGGTSTAQNTNGVNSNGEATSISAQGVEVTFTALLPTNPLHTGYGFDAYQSSQSQTKDLYKKLGSNYYIPYKAVAKGETDYIIANIHITNDSIKPEDVIFKTKDGVAIKKVANTATSYILELKGTLSDAEVETQAVIKQGNKYQIAGAFIQYQATPKNVNVVLVNTANANTESIKTDLKRIYKQAMVNVTITEINDFTDELNSLAPNRTIESGESGFLANYTAQQQAINTALKTRPDYKQNAYYLILTNKKPTTADEKGLMPLGRQFGYIYTSNAPPSEVGKTAAHELGHGAFQLKHPFSTHSYSWKEGSTNWLMDYSNSDHIPYVQWLDIHNPTLRIGVFDGDGEAEHNKNAHLALTLSGNIIDDFYLNDKKIAVSVLIANNDYTIGTIKYKGSKYAWNSQEKAFINGSEKIRIKEVSKTIDKVNLFRSRGDGCTYDYVVVNWSSDDEKATNTNERIQEKIKGFKDSDWKLSPFDIRNESCNNTFIKELLARDREECSYTEIQNGATALKNVLTVTDAQQVTNTVNNTCLSAIRNLDYTEIETLINIIASQAELKELSEVAILRLINAIKTDDYASFYAFLEKDSNKVLKHLVEEIDDASAYFWTDKKNYTNFIGALVTMFNQAPASLEKRWPTKADDFAARMINLNAVDYSSDTSSVFSPRFTSKINKGEYSESTGNVTLNDVYTTYFYNAFDVNGSGVTQTKHTEKITEVSPLTPIIIVPNTDKLPLIATALGENSIGNNNYIVPAIFLKYNSDKIRNDYIEKGIVTTLDVATIALSGGTALATKVTWVRRAWAMAEVAGAVGNIAVNSGTVDSNSNLGKAVGYYNVAMGIIGIKNVAQGGYKFVSNLPQATRTALQENKGLRDLLVAQYTQWKTLTTNLDNLSDAEKQLITQQEKVWKALGIWGEILDEMPVNFFENVNDIGSTFDKYNKISTTLRGEIYNYYKQQKWDKLEQLFKENKLNGGWPPANGGYKIMDDVSLTKGMKFDRYQDWFSLNKDGNPVFGGSFTSPIFDIPFSYSQRALKFAEKENALYYEIEILKDLPIKGQSADVIPWFGQAGGGKQMMFKFQPKGGYFNNFQDLIDDGYIKITIKSSPNGKYNSWIGKSFIKK